MRVVWICHFNNEELTKLLPLYKNVHEFAPWITNLIKEFENRRVIDLHIISPFYFLKKKVEFQLRGLNYYFFPVGVPIYHRYYPDYFPIDAFFGYCNFRRKVKKKINEIKPDIINLIGAENTYYAKSVLDLMNYPIIITIQGFISEFTNEKSSFSLKYRAKNEIKILKSFTHFIGEESSKDYIKIFNKKFKFYKAFFPVNEELIFELNNKDINIEKKYDLLYVGRIDPLKGIFEFIKVVNEIKINYKNDVKAAVVGYGNLDSVKNFAKNLNCSENIEFIPFLENQKKVFELVKSSKLILIPSLYDRLPATLREVMMLKVPIVAYDTGGIPYVNKTGENIILIKKGDYKEMAKRSYELMMDGLKCDKLVENAYKFAVEEFSRAKNVNIMIEAYKETIEDYKK